ncbi:MAG: hypothetical protein OH354_03050 [Candidatus Parvarchaeota archaeon]|nr:hypothetical protein [Candidatus Jingweiarchaeum tengchongense]
MKKKAQAALEYLMTYGWAILVIVIVIAALYALGVFTPKASVPCTPCFSSFAYLDHSYVNGTLTLKIRNGPRAIVVSNATFKNPSTGTLYGYNETWVSVGANGDIEKSITASLSKPYDVEITIYYTVNETGLQHTDTATIHG